MTFDPMQNNQLRVLAFEMLQKLREINDSNREATCQEVINKVESFLEKRGCWLDDGQIDQALLPDTCVLDEGEPHNCIYANDLFEQGKTKLDCKYWNAGQPRL